MPATSPTLSPTLSAIVAGLRGSSSGMPASTLPTRSAPTSAALVKMPPPTRANSAWLLAPMPKQSITVGDFDEAADRCQRTPSAEQEEPQRDVEQPEADDDQAHDGAGAEGDLQTLVERFFAANAVRAEAFVAVFMPNQPHRPEKNPATGTPSADSAGCS